MNSIKNSRWLDSPELEWQHQDENTLRHEGNNSRVSGHNCWGISRRMRRRVRQSRRSLFGHERYISHKYQRCRCRHDDGRSASVGSCVGHWWTTPLPRRTAGGLPGRVKSTNSGADGGSNSGGDWCVTGSSVGNGKEGWRQDGQIPWWAGSNVWCGRSCLLLFVGFWQCLSTGRRCFAWNWWCCIFCISSAAAEWGSGRFHGLDEFTEVRIYDEMGC